MKRHLLTLLLACLPFLAGMAQDGEWYSYCDGTIYSDLGGLGAGNDYEIAIKYTSAEVKAMGFTSVTEVKVGAAARSGPDLNASEVVIWQGVDGTTKKGSKSFTLLYNQWNTVTFDTPVEIDPNEDLYVAVHYDTKNSSPGYAALDNGLNHDGKSNLYRANGSTTWLTEDISKMGDWCIQFFGVIPTASLEYIGYNDGTVLGTLNRLGGNNYEIAIKYTSDDIKELGFTQIHSVKVGAGDQAGPPPSGTSIKVWQGTDGATEIASKSFTWGFSQWNSVAFDSPVTINPDEDLYIGVAFVTGSDNYPYAAYDASLNNPGKGDLYRVTGVAAWTEAGAAYGDWCIDAEVDLPSRFKVTFAGLQEATMSPFYIGPCSDAIISLGTKVNAAGNYEFSVPPGEYRYIVSKAGYVSLTGTITVTDADVTKSGLMILSGLDTYYTISFNIKDENQNTPDDAQVTFNGKAWDAGVYSADNIRAGIYDYSVSRFGYDTFEGTLIVIGNETINIDMIKQSTYKVTFDVEKVDPVLQQQTPITDAVVSAGLIVNSAGNYVFNLPPGKYPYIVTPDASLPTVSGFIEVVDTDVEKYVSITPGAESILTASFWIRNEAGDQLVNASKVTFNGEVLPANATTAQLKAGIYDMVVECEGYLTYTDKFILVEGADIKYIIMEAIPKYKVEFSVLGVAAPTMLPLTDAVVSLGLQKNAAGNYVFYAEAGTHTYVATRDTYTTGVGTVTITNKDIYEPIYLQPGTSPLYTMTLDIVNADDEAVTDAMVVLNGVGYASGAYTFEELPAGVHEVNVIRAGYATYTGKVLLTKDDTFVINIGEPDLTDITFVVRDQNNDPLEGATLVFGGQTIDGYVASVLPGSYSYIITKDGYEPAGGSITVTGNDDTVYVNLYPVKYTVTANINPENAGTVTGTGEYPYGEWATLTAVPNAGYKFVNWTMGGMEIGNQVDVRFPVEMDIEVTANFELMKYNVTAIVNPENTGTVTGTGEYPYGEWATLTAHPHEGYQFVNWTMGGMEIGNQVDVRFPVEMDIEVTANFEVAKYTVTFIVEDNVGNAINDATIVFDGETLTSYTTMVLPGTYTYSISKDNYNEVVKTITVSANTTVRVLLSPTVGINDIASSEIKLYPNPFVNLITIDGASDIYDHITISDISGSVKLSRSLNGEKSISTENLSQGTYLITLSNRAGNQKTYKMIKK